MSRDRLGRIGRLNRAGSGLDPVHAIVSIVNDGADELLVTTRGVHGLSIGQNIVISGTSFSNYNFGFQVDGTPSTTTFTLPEPYVVDSFGGTWFLQ
jgi:hypothetical protein